MPENRRVLLTLIAGFMDLGMGGYHIGPASAAVDVGVVTAESVDIDGDSRLIGSAPDIGADEGRWVFLPLVLRDS